MLFELGRVVATRGVDVLLQDGTIKAAEVAGLIRRHLTGDWGEMGEEDWKTNDQAVGEGDRVMSAYTVNGVKLWVITEADRRVTTVLLPEEY